MNGLKRHMALVMAFLLLITGTGFSMTVHYCAGEIRDVSFTGENIECEMMANMQKNACPMHTQATSSCCEDQDLTLEGDSHESYLVKTFNPGADLVAIPTPPVMLPVIPATQDNHTFSFTYRPPPPDSEIFLLVQSFRL